MELNFGTSAMTKAPVEDTVLPTGSSVGITVRDDYGRYTGDDYTNIRYSSALSAGVQVWETTSPVLLARETGTLFSYWPHSEDEVDGKTITVAATSDVQTDYMWGLPVAVSKSNRTYVYIASVAAIPEQGRLQVWPLAVIVLLPQEFWILHVALSMTCQDRAP